MQQCAKPSSANRDKVCEYLSIAMEYLRRGLQADEQGDYAQALKGYRRGIEVLREGMDEAVKDPVGNAAEVETFKRHLVNFTERSNTLEPLAAAAAPASAAPKKTGWFSNLFKKDPPATPPHASDVFALKRSLDPEASLRASLSSLPPPAAAPAQQQEAPPKLLRVARQAPSQDNEVPHEKRKDKASSTLLKNHDRKHIASILNDVVDPADIGVKWTDVTGLETSKQHLYEAAVLPLARPDLFTGLRAPPRGVLLFGPPGNGKTMLAKAVASESKATFFSISASSLVSKFMGEGEKMVRALFDCAEELQPSVVFIDEADSLLTKRGEEHDAMRRLKTEVLVKMDGVTTNGSLRVLVLAATNRPQDIDTACLRRFPKRVYLPLPSKETRVNHIVHLISKKSNDVTFSLSKKDLAALGEATDRFSFSDLTALVHEAAILPVRDLGAKALQVKPEDVRPVVLSDFERALKVIRPSASADEIAKMERWSAEYGTTG